MYGYTTCLIIPIHGRLWLPPDCETAESLCGRLMTHFHAETKAIHRDEAHIQQNIESCKKALAAYHEVMSYEQPEK